MAKKDKEPVGFEIKEHPYNPKAAGSCFGLTVLGLIIVQLAEWRMNGTRWISLAIFCMIIFYLVMTVIYAFRNAWDERIELIAWNENPPTESYDFLLQEDYSTKVIEYPYKPRPVPSLVSLWWKWFRFLLWINKEDDNCKIQ